MRLLMLPNSLQSLWAWLGWYVTLLWAWYATLLTNGPCWSITQIFNECWLMTHNYKRSLRSSCGMSLGEADFVTATCTVEETVNDFPTWTLHGFDTPPAWGYASPPCGTVVPGMPWIPAPSFELLLLGPFHQSCWLVSLLESGSRPVK